MAQTTILAAGTTDATSTAITVGAGSSVTVSLFSASTIPNSINMWIRLGVPSGSTQIVGSLTKYTPSVAITSPGTYYVERMGRNTDGVSVGAFTES